MAKKATTPTPPMLSSDGVELKVGMAVWFVRAPSAYGKAHSAGLSKGTVTQVHCGVRREVRIRFDEGTERLWSPRQRYHNDEERPWVWSIYGDMAKASEACRAADRAEMADLKRRVEEKRADLARFKAALEERRVTG